ncbi:dihydroorotase [Myroides pelagicus]|uniref:Dihydroorotase n=1 Tax=Myroides pelagicus TaxID=270914 RepID=A0A7K1GJM8_9FLAO|nr:dihydroorotase [Myroides pelagicus]MTH28940.1 dihydroorotase [Myroides pelagicus]
MTNYLIKNGTIINEGIRVIADLLIENGRIKKIGVDLNADREVQVIDAKGKLVLPGMIDDQVHFREPGLTHKGDIASESKAAVAGGITSFIEQPNTIPNAVSQEILEQKYQRADEVSFANYSFMMGGTNNNLDEVLKTNPRNVAGIKLFLGSSTGNMLVDDQEVLEKIFSSTSMLIAVHAEDEATIRENMAAHVEKYGDDIPVSCHPAIRSAEACYLSSSKAIELAKKTGARLHVFHVSTAKETELFRNDIPLKDKKITAEVCVHHLWFSDKDYESKGNFIKWNPAVKSAADREGLWKALLDDRIDVIATDHAPHTLEEKSKPYGQAPSGGPLVQHALIALLEAAREGKITVEKIVEKTAHNPATLFQIEKRGYLREGYHADIVIVDPEVDWSVDKSNVLYKCGWSPFEGTNFHSKVIHTFVNGSLVYSNGKLSDTHAGQRLLFDR